MLKLTYYRRIQLSFLLFIILPVLTVSVISFVLIKETMVEKLQLSNENLLNVIVKEIGKTVDDVTFASHFIVNDTSFRTYLKKFADTDRIRTYNDYVNYTQIKDGFSLITSKPLNNNIRMYLINRRQFVISSTADDLILVNGSIDGLFKRVDLNKPEALQWLGMVRDPSGSGGAYYIARVIRDNAESNYVSVLLISISASYFEGVLKPVEFGKLALFDASGSRITGSAELPLRVSKDTADSGLRSVVALDKTDWTLVYGASKEVFTGQISRTFYAGIGGVILFFIIFLFTSMVFAKRLHSPILKLQRVVRQFVKGNREVRLDVKGKDDIAELGSSLNGMLDQIQQLILDIEQEQEQKRVMELEALFMQIRPHFLMNTLNSIKCSLLLQEDRMHSGIIDSLMSLLRAYLKINEPTTLQEECSLLGHYVDIMKIRNEIPLELQVELPPDLARFVIPKLLLQPLVENAIVHGLVDHLNARIRVSAKREADQIMIEIGDNGEGMEEQQLAVLNQRLQSGDPEQLGSYPRVGLINVVQRLKLTYGTEAFIHLGGNSQGGVTAYLNIPVTDRVAFLQGGQG
ncbi:sensor histidine kinase [Paenibacillus tuaregi]|uniref:sensor histidine kinase n=1 Tax=Paenibacillus tuaregi TaxID=1816681 RepID=UPI000838A93B|nr:histidine kinase [Paenibacillus tuaregi]